jgi:Tfp pilus assembly protein PilV
MRTFFARLWYTARSQTGIGSAERRPATRGVQLAYVRAGVGSQDGFLLIEVLISTLLIGVMIIATYNGLDTVNRSTVEQRRHDEAAALAMESQEQLRTNDATALLALPSTGHAYTATVGGTKYTITQKASYGNGGETTGCSATEKAGEGKGTYILISSTVTWPARVSSPVTESSLITPPTGSALKVLATNSASIAAPSVPIVVTYTPVGTTTANTVEAITNSAGCALFAGIPATSAIVTARETQGIVTKWGSLYLPPTEVTLAPNVLTELPLTLAPGGRLEAQFRYNGLATYTHKNNAGTSTLSPENVTGDTFVAFNVNMKEAPTFETGSNQETIKMSGKLYEVLPDTEGGAYKATAETPKEPIQYPQGNLFPFPTGENHWTVYAGDCSANNPQEVTETAKATVVKPETAEVSAGGSRSVSVPLTYVALDVYHKTEAEITAIEPAKRWEMLETTSSYPVTITNSKCGGVTPNNETTLKTRHTQKTTIGSSWGGHLEDPFQPFGEYELCLYHAGKTYTVEPYTNTSQTTPVIRNIYLEELSNQEKEAARVAKEAATATARKAAESAEKTAWEAEVRANKKSGSEKESEDRAKESAQKTKRIAAEAAEKTAETNEKTAEAKEINEKEVAVESGKTSC